MNKNYTTLEKVEQFLNQEIEYDFNSVNDIDDYILAAQDYIENYTGRDFSSTEEVKVYNGNGKQELLIDPVLEVDGLEVSYDNGGTFTAETDYYLLPNNSDRKVIIGMKYNAFPKDVQNVKVEGTFGWSLTVPYDISFVATVLVAGMVKGKSTSEVASEKIGEYAVSYENGQDFADMPNLKSILDKYKRLN